MRTGQFYIDGAWVDPAVRNPVPVINPATEEAFASVSDGSRIDAERAIAAARAAFDAFGQTPKADRLELLRAFQAEFEKREEEFAQAISQEMGAPIDAARAFQTRAFGVERLVETIAALEDWAEEEATPRSGATILRQPVGVCALITPWNFPINQIAQKVFPALATGCTMILKPSIEAPLDAIILAECIHEAGYPKGVFNLIQGSGSEVGQVLASHGDVDMVSLTGSVGAGVAVSQAAAPTVKRVSLELGGKSPNLIFADGDVAGGVEWGVRRVMANSGQTCGAPTRMLVEKSVYDEAVRLAIDVGNTIKTGDPAQPGDHIGPLVNDAQYQRVQRYIRAGLKEGARLIVGGPGRPDGHGRGFFARPTIFADVDNQMTIAREEIFGPVLSIIPFNDEEDALRLANDSDYGLAGHVFSHDPARQDRVARALRVGTVGINGSTAGRDTPFGGVKRSGIGREGGRWGLEEFTEIKAIAR